MDDFDCLHGSWDVANRRLTAPLGAGPATSGDRGDFHGEDTYDGRPTGVRLPWYRLGPVTAHEEQEFSSGDGRTWEPHWTADLVRTGCAGA
ncbi:hypothetical protein PV721_28215 [Streptomyces sp. MB09-01]|uniref:hypothetical protein n=1 Tax=Streptomyces sp. MB09-01 TaxID=3028666 RepID=UPI0029A42ED9|nr:hypothetical protein [Streptomyces sp. MB09-01]MDX3538161.1 hypothetical protein [Streptomyces sp. MB09-01]